MPLRLKHLPPQLGGPVEPAKKRSRKGRTPPVRQPDEPLLTHMLFVEGWIPATLNELLRKGRWAWTLKKKDRAIIADRAARVGIPPATSKRRVTLTIRLEPRKHAGDCDAYFKSLLDGLKHAGLIWDDTPRWCELTPVQFSRGQVKATTVVLEDVP